MGFFDDCKDMEKWYQGCQACPLIRIRRMAVVVQGGFRQPDPLGLGGSIFSKHPHPHSPSGKQWTCLDITKALNNHFQTPMELIVSVQFIPGNGFTSALEVLKVDKLKARVPDLIINQIPLCASKFHINTPLRLAHFLAQCSHESAGFKVTQENLNYSADGLKKTFPKYFPDNLAGSYARQPQKIAARIYGGRMGNGDEASKEGYKYRGRGYIQLTGKDNYRAFDKTVDDDILNNPDLVSDKYPLLSAAWFWSSRSINKLADKGSSDKVVTSVTKKINGGTIGLADRITRFKKFYALLT